MLNKLKNKRLFLLLFIVVCYNMFFINRAFHIDDPYTILITRAVNWNFIKVPPIPAHNPILLGYYYAPIVRIFGENNLWLHIFYLPFTLLVVLSMYFLSLRFAGKSLFPTLLFVVMPAFVVTSHGIMLDIPSLGFFLASLAVFIRGIDKENTQLLCFAGILAGVAILIKYYALILIPVMFLYVLLFSRKRTYILFIFIPVAILLFWVIYNLVFYKNIRVIDIMLLKLKNNSLEQIIIRFFACLSFISGTSIIGLLLTPALLKKTNSIFLLCISAPVGLFPFLLRSIFSEYSLIEKTFLAMLFISSLFIICLIGEHIFRYIYKKSGDKDNLFLAVWFMLFLFFIICTQFVAARFVLLLFPPMVLIIYKEMRDIGLTHRGFLKKIISLVILISFIISTVLAVGDYQFAGIYRDIMVRLKGMGIKKEQIFFCPFARNPNSSWEYAYYVNLYYPRSNTEKYKIVCFPRERVLPMVIMNSCKYFPIEGFFGEGSNIDMSEYIYAGHVFLHNRGRRTGFYSHDWGLLPFKIFPRKETLERFMVYRQK